MRLLIELNKVLSDKKLQYFRGEKNIKIQKYFGGIKC